MTLCDFHVHTAYCDGADTPRQMAEEAFRRGFSILGFTGHGYGDHEQDYCMSRENVLRYRQEIAGLKEEYRGRMEILCGVEKDSYSKEPTTGFDYVIGSVHFVKTEGGLLPLDLSQDSFLAAVDAFGGDFEALAENYFEEVGRVIDKTGGCIIGHFDLLTKYSEKVPLSFGQRYWRAATEALDRLVSYDIPFEVNVGAMSRGYRTAPYPSQRILQEIYRRGGKIIFTGDCHDRQYLGRFFDVSHALAWECGFRTCQVLTGEGFRTEEILL